MRMIIPNLFSRLWMRDNAASEEFIMNVLKELVHFLSSMMPERSAKKNSAGRFVAFTYPCADSGKVFWVQKIRSLCSSGKPDETVLWNTYSRVYCKGMHRQRRPGKEKPHQGHRGRNHSPHRKHKLFYPDGDKAVDLR